MRGREQAQAVPHDPLEPGSAVFPGISLLTLPAHHRLSACSSRTVAGRNAAR